MPDSDLLQVDGFVTLNNLFVQFLDFSVLFGQPLIQRLNDALVFPLQGVLRIRQDPVLALQLLKVLSVEHHLRRVCRQRLRPHVQSAAVALR